MPSPVKSFGYIKCYSSSSPRPIKSPSNSTRYNYQKITISQGDQRGWLTIFLKTLLTIKRRLTEQMVFVVDLSPTFFISGTRQVLKFPGNNGFNFVKVSWAFNLPNRFIGFHRILFVLVFFVCKWKKNIKSLTVLLQLKSSSTSS